jgi:ElaA protein
MDTILIKKFEELTLNELYNIMKLRSKVFVVEQNCVYQDLDDIDKISYHFFIKGNDDNIKAYLRIFVKDEETAQIGRVVTDEKERRKGLASNLIKKGIEFCKKEMKKNKVYLEGQVYCKDLYLHLGFNIISDEFLEDGIPHYKMLKIID